MPRCSTAASAAPGVADPLGNVPCVAVHAVPSPGPTAAETLFPLTYILCGHLSLRTFKAALCLPLSSVARCQ